MCVHIQYVFAFLRVCMSVQFQLYCTIELLSVSVFILGFPVNPSRTSQIVDMEFPFNNSNHWSHCGEP